MSELVTLYELRTPDGHREFLMSGQISDGSFPVQHPCISGVNSTSQCGRPGLFGGMGCCSEQTSWDLNPNHCRDAQHQGVADRFVFRSPQSIIAFKETGLVPAPQLPGGAIPVAELVVKL